MIFYVGCCFFTPDVFLEMFSHTSPLSRPNAGVAGMSGPRNITNITDIFVTYKLRHANKSKTHESKACDTVRYVGGQS